MATTWSPRTNFMPTKWLLMNGEVVNEPPLEETPSGRKVRVAGTDISAFAKDIDSVIAMGVHAVAEQRGTKLWMKVDDTAAKIARDWGYGARAKLEDFATDGIKLWWRFRHHTWPIEAFLVANVRSVYSYRHGGRAYQLSYRVVAPITNYALSLRSAATALGPESNWAELALGDYQLIDRMKVAARTRNQPWMKDLDSTEETMREALRHLLKVVRDLDDLSEIEIPHLGDLDRPDWVPLEFLESNITGDLTSAIAEMLDGLPIITEAAEHYKNLVKSLARVGIVLEDEGANVFSEALAAGDTALTVKLSHPIKEGPESASGLVVDGGHTLTMHLPSGTFIVNCTKDATGKDEIATKWEEAHTLASLTGQEDELLAYARAYCERRDEERTKGILAKRGVTVQ